VAARGFDQDAENERARFLNPFPKPRAATEGRPYSTFRNYLFAGLSRVASGGLIPRWWIYPEKVSHKEVVAL
jgi:hypothetical protein